MNEALSASFFVQEYYPERIQTKAVSADYNP